MSLLCFNLQQLSTIDSFMSIKFSLANILVLLLKLCFLQSILLNFFLLDKFFLQFFLFLNRIIAFYNFCLPALPNLWQASMYVLVFHKYANISQNWLLQCITVWKSHSLKCIKVSENNFYVLTNYYYINKMCIFYSYM